MPVTPALSFAGVGMNLRDLGLVSRQPSGMVAVCRAPPPARHPFFMHSTALT
jgi:hypothetical protein